MGKGRIHMLLTLRARNRELRKVPESLKTARAFYLIELDMGAVFNIVKLSSLKKSGSLEGHINGDIPVCNLVQIITLSPHFENRWKAKQNCFGREYCKNKEKSWLCSSVPFALYTNVIEQCHRAN